MNILWLRGKADRPKEISYKSIGDCWDTWEQLAFGITTLADVTKVYYWGGKRNVSYSPNFEVRWITKLSKYADFEPDVIIARGGFPEYVPLLKRFPKATKIRYGANHGCIPKDGIKYDLILCDSPKQVEKCKKHGLNGQLFIKPAPPQFKPMNIPKKYDCCFVAIHPEDKRKNVKWVYKTLPKDISVLQLGHYPKKLSVPKNVKVKYIKKESMPKAINKCRVLMAPYTSEDSCPRVIPEALACGVYPVVLESVNVWERYHAGFESKEHFWELVEAVVKHPAPIDAMRLLYETELSIPAAANHLRELIENVRKG